MRRLLRARLLAVRLLRAEGVWAKVVANGLLLKHSCAMTLSRSCTVTASKWACIHQNCSSSDGESHETGQSLKRHLGDNDLVTIAAWGRARQAVLSRQEAVTRPSWTPSGIYTGI